MPVMAGANKELFMTTRIPMTATIALNATTSNVINLEKKALIGFQMPSAWTTGAISIQVSPDGKTWGTPNNEYGAATGSFANPTVNTPYATDRDAMLPWQYIRFVAGVAQEAAREITLIARVFE